MKRGDRKKSDDKYKQSEKGKKSQEKWNCWEKKQNYYKEADCLSCGKLKKIVSKGLCDSCRKKETRRQKKLSQNT